MPFLFNRIYHLTLWPSLTNGTQGDGGDGRWFLMAVTWKRKRERKRGRDPLLPEMALAQRGGVNSPSDVLQWNQPNYSPGSACVISSTDVKIIASAPLKFNGSNVAAQDAEDLKMAHPPRRPERLSTQRPPTAHHFGVHIQGVHWRWTLPLWMLHGTTRGGIWAAQASW